jgi:hypothetical protein
MTQKFTPANDDGNWAKPDQSLAQGVAISFSIIPFLDWVDSP